MKSFGIHSQADKRIPHPWAVMFHRGTGLVQAIFNAQTVAVYQAVEGLTVDNTIELLKKWEPFPEGLLKRL